MHATRDRKIVILCMPSIRDKKSVVLCMLPVLRKDYVMHGTRDRKSIILCMPSEIRKVLLHACHNTEEKRYFIHIMRNAK